MPLSDCLRAMRCEFQTALLDAGEYVQISALHLQSYALALAMYEDEAQDMEQRLEKLAVATDATGTIIPFPRSHQKRSQLLLVQADGDGGDAA